MVTKARRPVETSSRPARSRSRPPPMRKPPKAAFNGLITNDKFCLTRTVWLRLSWPRARGLRRASAPLNLCDELTHCGGEDATATQLAGPAHRCTHGQRSAALGPGLSASPAMGGSAPTPAGGDAGAF